MLQHQDEIKSALKIIKQECIAHDSCPSWRNPCIIAEILGENGECPFMNNKVPEEWQLEDE